MSKLTELLFGTPGSARIEERGTFSPEQQELFRLLMGGGSEGQMNLRSLYSSLGSDQGFREGVQTPAIQAFNEEVLPGLTRNFQRGLYSSDRGRAEGQALDSLSKFLVQARAQDLGRRQQLQSTIGTNQMQLLAALLGIPQLENIALTTPGTEGILGDLIGAGGRIGAAALTGGASAAAG